MVGTFVWGFPFFFPFSVSIPFPSISFFVPVIHLPFFFSSFPFVPLRYLVFGIPFSFHSRCGQSPAAKCVLVQRKVFDTYSPFSPVEFCGEFLWRYVTLFHVVIKALCCWYCDWAGDCCRVSRGQRCLWPSPGSSNWPQCRDLGGRLLPPSIKSTRHVALCNKLIYSVNIINGKNF